MTFRKWLKQFEHDNTPFGDLARDAEYEFAGVRHAKRNGYQTQYKPWRNSYHWIKNHLKALGACSAAMETFKEAWAAYRKAEETNNENTCPQHQRFCRPR